MYRKLDEKKEDGYDEALVRINKNLSFFKDARFSEVLNGFDAHDFITEQRQKMVQIDTQIKKMQKVIESGCGEIVKK